VTAKQTRAAELWARIEATLPGRFTISDTERAALIRAVGEVITGRWPQPRKTSATVPAPEPMEILAPVRLAVIKQTRRAVRSMPDDEEITRRLDQFLDRACGVVGYSDDDEVRH
jgi:hypothetical protein